MAMIHDSIIAAMADIEPIAKAQKNQKQGFSFRGIDEIMNELQPVLKKHNLFVVPKVSSIVRSEKQSNGGGVLLYSVATMEYTMYAKDGSFIVGSTIGEGMDSGDKASNKAMSVALKYFLLQTFCIPTEDAKDPDADSYTVSAPRDTKTKENVDTLKSEVVGYINQSPSVYNDEWTTYAMTCCDNNDKDGLEKCAAMAKRILDRRSKEK